MSHGSDDVSPVVISVGLAFTYLVGGSVHRLNPHTVHVNDEVFHVQELNLFELIAIG